MLLALFFRISEIKRNLSLSDCFNREPAASSNQFYTLIEKTSQNLSRMKPHAAFALINEATCRAETFCVIFEIYFTSPIFIRIPKLQAPKHLFHKQPGTVAYATHLRHCQSTQEVRVHLFQNIKAPRTSYVISGTKPLVSWIRRAVFDFRVICRRPRQPNRECVQVVYTLTLKMQNF